MYKRLLALTVFIIVFVTYTGNSLAKIEFNDLDDEVIAYVNDYKISVDYLSVAREKSEDHAKDEKHPFKKFNEPDSLYLKAVMDKRVMIQNAVLSAKDSSEYKRALKVLKEDYVLKKFIKDEIIDNVKGANDKEIQDKVSEAVLKLPDELRQKHKVSVHDEIIKSGNLKSGYDPGQVAARVDDYDITILDVILKSSPYYYDQENPDNINIKVLEDSLKNLTDRAIILTEALKRGYGDDYNGPSDEEKEQLMLNASRALEYKKIKVTEEEIEKAYINNPNYYEKYAERKYAAIFKTNEEDIKKIKKRIDAGEDFFEIAKAESEDEPSRVNGGILDFSTKDYKEIKIRFSRLKDGEVGEIFKFKKYYMIIKRLAAKYDNLLKLKSIIDSDIRQRRLKNIMSEKMTKLRKDAKIIINKKYISKEKFFNLKNAEEKPIK